MCCVVSLLGNFIPEEIGNEVPLDSKVLVLSLHRQAETQMKDLLMKPKLCKMLL